MPASKQASSCSRLHRPSCSLLIYLNLDIDLWVQPSIPSFYTHYRCFDASSLSPSLSTHSDWSRHYPSSLRIDCIDLHVSKSSQALISIQFIYSLCLFHISIVSFVVYLFLIRFVKLYASTRRGHRAACSRFNLIAFASKLVSLHRFYYCFVLYSFYTS
jgi:hypothetical protein